LGIGIRFLDPLCPHQPTAILNFEIAKAESLKAKFPKAEPLEEETLKADNVKEKP
jgi:hypothetical protein